MSTAGDLRESIRLEERVPGGDDGYGNTLPDTWTLRATTPARIRILKGSETVMAGRLQGTQTAVITVRNQPSLASATNAWRAANARTGQTYNIRAVTPDERGAFVDILAESGIPS
ncbi:MAG TPA: phage head closure protein [Bosea sp. (in: a-proteobacteria)]|jgi:SPP1 family predicted phage head-tail adaptor|uniref:phage head closure protein n=1 Tax=Bosea sp. (in: a-proteobacteria) TaxID=1871050 RepID=UPI002E110BB2|nr:phage head closure protein [Bosea sp. (in: a-proteobacteria)]